MGGQYSQLLFILILVAVFWFVAIRPQQQRTKQQKAMLAALKPGDEIVTIGGLYATVVSVGERVRVKGADGAELEFAPQAITRVVPASAEPEPVETDDDSAEAGSSPSDQRADVDA